MLHAGARHVAEVKQNNQKRPRQKTEAVGEGQKLIW